jgi:hypothetical protein
MDILDKFKDVKNLEDLDKLQNEMLSEIDKQIKDDEEIVHAVQDIVSSLNIYAKANAEINGKKYMVKTKIHETGQTVLDSKGNKQTQKQVILIAMDVVKAQIMEGKYIPCIVRVDFNPELTMKGNITAAVEGWVRHITGNIKPEMLEN